ncbi:MAG: glycosyltransferase family 2 protein [Terriglobales bacterium]
MAPGGMENTKPIETSGIGIETALLRESLQRNTMVKNCDETMTDSVLVSIVAYNGKRFLQRCLDGVLSQTYRPIEICLLDNASEDGTGDFVTKHFPSIKVIPSSVNLGFGGGHNVIIRQARSPFILVLNQDAFLSPTFLEELITAVKERPEVGIAGGKLYSLRKAEPDAAAGEVIDMTWLDIEKKRRQVCYAHSQSENGQPAVPTFAFAMDGAAMLLRRAMLQEIEIDGEFYDEDFFAGKEDLDISWRAQLCGWKCLYVPSAVGHHFRTFTPKDRRSEISGVLRAGSVRNRYLLMLKNDLFKHFIRHLPHIALYDLKILAYTLLYERSSLAGYGQVLRLIPRALKKRRFIMARKNVDDAYILQWFR